MIGTTFHDSLKRRFGPWGRMGWMRALIVLLVLSATFGTRATLFHHDDVAGDTVHYASLAALQLHHVAETSPPHHEPFEHSDSHEHDGEHHHVVLTPLFVRIIGAAASAGLMFAPVLLTLLAVAVFVASSAGGLFSPKHTAFWSSVTPSLPPVARLLRSNHALLN